ncbi:UNVERIFIED_CONTAM: hypothetical protein K2H54_013090 [Gekko kuhli]
MRSSLQYSCSCNPVDLVTICILAEGGKKLPANISEDAEEGEVSDEDSADEIDDDCKLMNGDVSIRKEPGKRNAEMDGIQIYECPNCFE